MQQIMLSIFKYHPDPIGTGAFKTDKIVKCDCCQEETDIYYTSPFYTRENVDYICPRCIANGAAAEIFEGEFVDVCSIEQLDGTEPGFDDDGVPLMDISIAPQIDELVHRTPCYGAWQQERWLAHCGDFCAYVGAYSWQELEEMGLADEIEEGFDSDDFPIDVIKENCDGCDMVAYLFRCLKCGRHRICVDCS